MAKWPLLPRAARSIFLGLVLAAGCTSSTPPAEPGAQAVELRGALEQRALLQSEYQRIR